MTAQVLTKPEGGNPAETIKALLDYILNYADTSAFQEQIDENAAAILEMVEQLVEQGKQASAPPLVAERTARKKAEADLDAALLVGRRLSEDSEHAEARVAQLGADLEAARKTIERLSAELAKTRYHNDDGKSPGAALLEAINAAALDVASVPTLGWVALGDARRHAEALIEEHTKLMQWAANRGHEKGCPWFSWEWVPPSKPCTCGLGDILDGTARTTTTEKEPK